MVSLFTVLCVVPFLPPESAAPGPGNRATIQELRDAVREREREFKNATADSARARLAAVRDCPNPYAREALALVRARLAMAEGKLDRAAREWRIVATWYEDRLRLVETLYARGRICDDGSGLEQARSSVAEVRAFLAEAERKPEVVVAELRKVYRFRTGHMISLRRLMEKNAITEEDFRNAEKELHEIIQRLEAAERACGMRN